MIRVVRRPLFPLFCALLGLGLAAACARHPANPPLPQMGRVAPAEIAIDPQTGRRHAALSVLIYNVAGLPWPVRSGRGPALDRIGGALHVARNEGAAPQVLLLQEAFVAKAGQIGIVAGYPNRWRGPLAGDASEIATVDLDPAFLAGRSFWKGERSGKLVSSGLYVFADYPIIAAWQSPFGPRTCAGFDCLANKGVMMVVIEIPGVPQPVQILNTHLNARGASGVGRERTLYAHQRQVDEIRAFLDRHLNPDWPLIYGGDFNTRRSPSRYDHKAAQMPGTVVDYYCAIVQTECDVRMSWDGDEPWLDTQDLQGFSSGSAVRLRPVRVEARFDAPVADGPLAGQMLSDHDGYLVTYELSWPATATE
jgi:hypothetical protein